MPTEGEITAARVSVVAVEANDDELTVVAISLVAQMLADVVHEGLGHAAVALLTVAWSSEGDWRLVAAGIRLHL